jgi:histidine kinase
VVDSVDTAFLAGLVVAVLASGVVAVLVGRRLLRPIDSVRDAAEAMARGDYGRRVPIPAEEELAALANDVNTLSAALEETEQRRTRLIGEVAMSCGRRSRRSAPIWKPSSTAFVNPMRKHS